MTQLSPLGTKRLIKSLFGSQLAAARALHFSERNVRYWCMFGAPLHVGKVLRRMRDEGLSVRTARQLLRQNRERRVTLPRPFAPPLQPPIAPA
jgi:23S rRNA A1618 N6-methylase RlmF